MPAIAILFGILLTLLGLIPCVAGVLLIFLGLLSLRPAMRKHAMHAAAMIALLGIIAPLGRLMHVAVRIGLTASPAVISQFIMAILCAIFLALCIRSFVMARRNRKSAGQAA